MRALFKDLDLVVIRNLMDVNFWGTVYCTKYAMPELLKSKGSVVGISSIAGYRGLPGRTGYSASKFAMNGFLEALRVENLKTGLHVMIAAPGFTASNIRNTALSKDGEQHGETSMDEGKMMSSEEVARTIVDGVVKQKRTLIMTGQGKLAVLMNKLVPAWVDNIAVNNLDIAGGHLYGGGLTDYPLARAKGKEIWNMNVGIPRDTAYLDTPSSGSVLCIVRHYVTSLQRFTHNSSLISVAEHTVRSLQIPPKICVKISLHTVVQLFSENQSLLPSHAIVLFVHEVLSHPDLFPFSSGKLLKR